MADVIMTFRYLNEVQVQPSKVLMRVGIVGAGNDMTMHLDYNPRKGIRVAEVFGNPVETNYVKTAKGLVEQANARFKQIYGANHDTPVLHIKSFRLSDEDTGAYHDYYREYAIQDLTRISELFGYLLQYGIPPVGTVHPDGTPVGGWFPTSFMELNGDECFSNILNNPVNPIDGVDVSHGDSAFRKSMTANGFKLIR